VRKPISLIKLFVIVICSVLAWPRSGDLHAEKNDKMAVTAATDFPAPVLSPQMPDHIPFQGPVTGPESARPFFDYFSWQSFVALNWPAAMGADGNPQRGIPNEHVEIGGEGPRVWESWKADWEIFRPGGAPPTDWSSYELNPPGGDPCGNPPSSRKVLVMISKTTHLVGGINQADSGPLIDQN
jgi:hypothetical protein